MGLGLGLAAKGAVEGQARGRAQQIQDEEIAYTKARREIEDPMKDQSSQFRNDALARDNEIAVIMQDARKRGAEVLADTAVMKAISENINAQYKGIFDTYKLAGGERAAQLFNDVKSNGVTNAANMQEFKDPKTGKKMLRIVDVEGNVVSDPNHGEAVFDLDELNTLFGTKPEKGRYSQQDDTVLDTATGRTSNVGGLPGGSGAVRGSKKDKEFRKLIDQGNKAINIHYGKKEGNEYFIEEKNKGKTLAAKTILETMVRGSNKVPLQAGRHAVQVVDEVYKSAEKAAKAKAAEEGRDDEYDYVDSLTQQIATQALDGFIADLPSADGATSGDGGSRGKGKPASSGEPNKTQINYLKNIRKQFDARFGEGASARYLAGGSTPGKGIKTGGGGSTGTVDKDEASIIDGLKLKLPTFDNTPEGAKAQQAFDEQLQTTADMVEKSYRNGTIGQIDEQVLRFVLNSDLSDRVKSAIAAQLKGK
jgi:hypothetical protein